MAHYDNITLKNLALLRRPFAYEIPPGKQGWNTNQADSMTVTVRLDASPREDAVVRLYSSKTGNLLATKKTNANGVVVFDLLDATNTGGYFAVADCDGVLQMQVFSRL